MRMAASLSRLARSAPVKPGVRLASTSRSALVASGLPWACTARILLAPGQIGAVHDDLAVEPTGPEQGRVENVGTVGGRRSG